MYVYFISQHVILLDLKKHPFILPKLYQHPFLAHSKIQLKYSNKSKIQQKKTGKKEQKTATKHKAKQVYIYIPDHIVNQSIYIYRVPFFC